MKTTIYFNGKPIKKKDLPKEAVLKWKERVSNDHYETPEYTKQKDEKNMKAFRKSMEMYNDMKRYHG